MLYRIELSRTRKGFARLQLPGREIAVEARQPDGAEWQVALTDLAKAQSGTVGVRAADANEAVWRVARAAVRAVSELTGTQLEEDHGSDPAPFHSPSP